MSEEEYIIPIYYNGKYYYSLKYPVSPSFEYLVPITVYDRLQLIDDAMGALERVKYSKIHVGSNKFGHISVFAESE